MVPRRTQLRDHGEPIFTGKHDIEHDRIETLLLPQQTIGCRFAIANHLGDITLGFKIEGQSLCQVRLVFDHKHSTHESALVVGESVLGNSMTTVVPCPSPALSANASP